MFLKQPLNEYLCILYNNTESIIQRRNQEATLNDAITNAKWFVGEDMINFRLTYYYF